MLSSTSSTFQSPLKDDGSRKYFETQNPYEKESIFPLSYSELTQCKSNFSGPSSESIEAKKPIQNTDMSLINKPSMPFYNSRDNINSKIIACAPSFEESKGEKSEIRDAASNKMNAMSSSTNEFDITRHSLEKVKSKIENAVNFLVDKFSKKWSKLKDVCIHESFLLSVTRGRV